MIAQEPLSAAPVTARQRSANLLWMLGLGAVAYWFRAAHPFHLFDDAFITFRYAANLAEGRGFVYNAGERVLGTTTPLHALLLAAGGRLLGVEALPGLARRIGWLADAGSVMLVARMLRNAWGGRWQATLGAAMLVFSIDSVIHAGCGMEGGLFALLCLAALALAGERRHGPAHALAALAALTRPEGLLVLVLTGLHQAVARTRPRWSQCVFPLLALAGWSAFALAYFGSVRPHSMAAKWAIQGVDPGLSPLRRLLLFHNLNEVGDFLGNFIFKLRYQSPLVRNLTALPVIGLYGLGLATAWRRASALTPTLVFGVLFAAAYAMSPTLMFSWYYCPLFAPLALGIASGLLQLGDWASRAMGWHGADRWRRPELPGLALLAVVGLVMLGLWPTMDHGLPSRIEQTIIPGERETLYAAAARCLKRQPEAPAIRTVMAVEIGALGFEGRDWRIIDLAGLVTPEVVELIRRNPAKVNRITWDVLRQFHPDALIALRGDFDPEVLASPEFARLYEPRAVLHGRDWGVAGVLVHLRRDLSDASAATRHPSVGD